MDLQALLNSHPIQRSCVIIVEVPQVFEPVLDFLSQEECMQAARLRNAELQRNFYARRMLVRRLLSHWSGIHPSQLPDFCHNPFGKPMLEGSPLHFNISHSKQYFSCYFGAREGGIDIEVIGDAEVFREIREQHFHPEEIACAKTNAGFYSVWTRKEAVLKAAGTGLTEGLHNIDCSGDSCTVNNQPFSLITRIHGNTVCSIALLEPPGADCDWYFIGAGDFQQEIDDRLFSMKGF